MCESVQQKLGHTKLHRCKMIYLLFFQVFNRDEPDREKLVHVTVKASDKGRPQLEDVCTLSVKVKDKNDNKPIFDRGQYDEPVAQDTPVGTQIMRVSATDVDEGENQKISYDLSATRIPGLLITFLFVVFLIGKYLVHYQPSYNTAHTQ